MFHFLEQALRAQFPSRQVVVAASWVGSVAFYKFKGFDKLETSAGAP
jgi:hypothetical protein